MEEKEIQHVGVVDLKQFEETHEEKILLSYVDYNVLLCPCVCIYIYVCEYVYI